MTFLNSVSNAISSVGDFVTAAWFNKSGLLSALNEVLGPVPTPDHPSKLEQRAEAMGMISTIRRWQTAPTALRHLKQKCAAFSYRKSWTGFLNRQGFPIPPPCTLSAGFCPGACACVPCMIRPCSRKETAFPHRNTRPPYDVFSTVKVSMAEAAKWLFCHAF